MQFTRRRDLQVTVFENAAVYLGLAKSEPDFVHLTPETSRRLRALPAWFTLSAYGRDGDREIVERDVAAARQLGELLAAVPNVRLLAPVRLNVVCFAINGFTPDQVADAVTASGETFLTTTVLDGVPALCAAFSNWRTTPADVDRVYRAITEAVT